MKIEVKAKIGTKAWFLSKKFPYSLIPCECIGINIYQANIDYYFDDIPFAIVDEDFDDIIFTDYNLACDALEDYRKEMLNE